MDDHAQEEIRVYASVIGEQIVAKWVPLVWEAFTDYRREAMYLSKLEIAIVSAMAEGRSDRAGEVFQSIASKRERREIEQKLLKLGFTIPWS
jgi:thymidylate synthase (FAD)